MEDDRTLKEMAVDAAKEAASFIFPLLCFFAVILVLGFGQKLILWVGI